MKIGFCFLSIDNIYNINLWKSFFKNISKNEYGIYIHSKKKITCELNNSKILNNTIQTKWGCISLVRASILLFTEALNDNCDYMILLSSDTIPLFNFNYIRNKLTCSMFYTKAEMTKRQYSYKDYVTLPNEIKNKISFNNFKKQNMFFGITKSDFIIIINNNKTDMFKEIQITGRPDEFYFINMFQLLNLKYKNYNFIFVNDNLQKTQAIDFKWELLDIEKIKKNKFLFLRKIKSVPHNIGYYLYDDKD